MSHPRNVQTGPYIRGKDQNSIKWWNRFERIKESWLSNIHLKLTRQDPDHWVFEEKGGWFMFYVMLGISSMFFIFPLTFLVALGIPIFVWKDTDLLSIIFGEIIIGGIFLLFVGIELLFLDVTFRELFNFRSTKHLVLDRKSKPLTLELNPWRSPPIKLHFSREELNKGIKLESRDDGYKSKRMWYVLAIITTGELQFLRSEKKEEAEELLECLNLFLQGETPSIQLIPEKGKKDSKFLWVRPNPVSTNLQEPWICFKRTETLQGTVILILFMSFFGFIFAGLLALEVGSWEALIALSLFLSLISFGVFSLPILAYFYLIFIILYHLVRRNPQLEIWVNQQGIVLRNKVRFGKIIARYEFADIKEIEAHFGMDVIDITFLLNDYINSGNQTPLKFKLLKHYDQQVIAILQRLDPWIPTKTVRLV